MLKKELTLILAVLLISLAKCQEKGTSLDDLINSVFNTNAEPVGNKNDNFQPVPTQTTVLNPTPATPKQDGQSCGIQKQCVPRFLCQNEEIITDGIGLIDIRIGDNDTPCGYLEVCCDLPHKTDVPIIAPKPPMTHEGCGYRNADGVGYKIVGGTDEAEFGEFPWMVAILREERSVGDILNLYECGGSIVAPNAIVTAAHCVQTRKASDLVVRAGEWDTQTKSEVLPHQDRRVQEIIVHENYNKGSLFNDIAVLILETPLVWEENVRPICLPEVGQQQELSRCFATGWGKDKFGKEGKYQVILKKIDVPLVDHNTCQANLRTTRLGKFFQLHDSFTCAGGEKGKDTCKGDGGSPLVCPMPNNPKRYYQAGIVAWGVGCGEVNIPGVYGNVNYLRPWLNEKLSAHNIDFQYFTAY